MSSKQTGEGLRRVVGISGLTLNIVNFTIGAGIFVLPAVVGISLGSYSLWAYLFCGAMLATIMLCYAEIGSKVTSTGGSYAYVEAAFGTFAGFIVNSLFVFAWGVFASAALMNIIADSLAIIFPVFTSIWMRGSLFFIVIGFMVLINIRGVKHGIALVKLVTILKLIPLLGIIIFGFSHIHTANLYSDQVPTLKTFGNTVLMLFFLYAGFESALGVSGEIKNPKRTVPMGILFGAIVIIVLYLLLQIVTQGVLGTQLATVKDAPLAAVAEKIMGSAGGTILLITAAVSCFGNVGGDVMNTPRVLFAGANDGLFPKFLAKVHPKFATPFFAVIIYALLILIFSLAGGFQQLAILASAAILLIYLAVILAALKLRKVKQDATDKTFKVPGGMVIHFMAIAAILWLLSNLSKWEIFSIGIFLAGVCVIYFLMGRVQRSKVVLINDADRKTVPFGINKGN